MAKLSSHEIYALARERLGREPDAPENKYNYLDLADLSREELEKRMGQETPASGAEKKQFYESLGWDYDRSQLLDDMVSTVANIVDAATQAQEEALGELGIFEFDEEAIREQIMEEPGFKDFIQEKYDVMDREIREGRIRTQEDFDFRIRQVEDEATDTLANVAITEAQTNEELKNRLADIGATTEFNLGAARRKWRETRRGEIAGVEGRGVSFSGQAKRILRELEEAKKAETGEITRVGEVAKQEADVSAKYTLERATAQREAVQRMRERETGRAEELRGRGSRMYGEEGTPGWYETEERARIDREKENLLMSEIEQRRREAREEHEMAARLAEKEATYPEAESYLDKFRKRGRL